MSGHRGLWSILILVVLSGCRSDGTFRNPFARSETPAEKDPAFSLPKFARKSTDDRLHRIDSSATAVVATEQVERLLQTGLTAVQNQQLDEATKAYSEVLESDPDNATAHHGLAMVADLSQNWSDAEYHYKQALRVRPRDANLLCDIGYSYVLQNRFDEAARYLNQAIEINSQHESAHMNLALLDLKRGNRAAAEQRIGELYGSVPQAAQVLAQLEEQAGVSSSVASAGSMLAEKAMNTIEIPPNATEQEILALARQQRLLAEQQRAVRGVAQAGNAAANGLLNSVATSFPAGGVPVNPAAQSVVQAPGVNAGLSPAVTGASSSQEPFSGISILPRESQPPGAQPLSSMAGGALNTTPGNPGMTANAGGPAMPANPASALPQSPGVFDPAMQTGMAQGYGGNPGNSGFVSSGAAPNAMMPSAPMPGNSMPTASMPSGVNGVPAAAVATPAANGVVTGVNVPAGPVPIRSTGAFQQPDPNSASYGQPAGFPMAPGMSGSGMGLAPSGGNSGLRLEGLNIGPGSLFPVSAPGTQGQAAPGQGMQPAAGSMTPDAGFGMPMPGSPVNSTANPNMGTISSPGSGSLINGAMYSQPSSVLPAQEWANTMNALNVRANGVAGAVGPSTSAAQVSQFNGNSVPQAAAGNQGSLTAPWPAARPATSNGLEAYERQRQQLDDQYNKTLQQMNRNFPSATQAKY